jgi:hypothetical protein
VTTRNLRESFEKLELAKLEAEKQHPDDMPGSITAILNQRHLTHN